MKTSSSKLYFATFILTLTLTSFGFAGDVHCPFDGTPPDEDGRNAPVVTDINPSVSSNYQFLKGFWELLTQNTDLF
jgi:hypothetical protein